MRTVVALMFCGLFASGSAQAADCPLTMLGSVDLQVSPDRLLVPMTFGTVEKTFSLDIGSAFNAITQEAAEQAGFHLRSLDPNIKINVLGQKVVRTGNSPKFRMGTLPGDDVEFAILPQRLGDGAVSGSLGNRLFDRLDFELDIAQHKLNVFSPDHCPEKVVYWTKTGFAELPFRREGPLYMANMMLDDKPVHVTLSTSGGSVIGMSTVRELFKLDENSPGMTLVSTSPNGQKYYRYPFKSLTVDALTIGNPNILIYGEEAGAACNNRPRIKDTGAALGHVTDDRAQEYVTCFGPDLQIGLSVLSKLHVYFSSKEKLMYATGAGAP